MSAALDIDHSGRCATRTFGTTPRDPVSAERRPPECDCGYEGAQKLAAELEECLRGFVNIYVDIETLRQLAWAVVDEWEDTGQQSPGVIVALKTALPDRKLESADGAVGS